MKQKIRWIFCLVAILTVTGCSTVKPWQKGTFAKDEMAFTPEPLEKKLRDHTYFSKEGSSGGGAASGGGCGCN